MFNSYITTFGKVDKKHELAEDVSEWMHEKLFTIAKGKGKKGKYNFSLQKDPNFPPPPRPLTQKDKASILESAFHMANESFYQIEDYEEGFEDGLDSHGAQDVFLELVEKILKR